MEGGGGNDSIHHAIEPEARMSITVSEGMLLCADVSHKTVIFSFSRLAAICVMLSFFSISVISWTMEDSIEFFTYGSISNATSSLSAKRNILTKLLFVCDLRFIGVTGVNGAEEVQQTEIHSAALNARILFQADDARASRTHPFEKKRHL